MVQGELLKNQAGLCHYVHFEGGVMEGDEPVSLMRSSKPRRTRSSGPMSAFSGASWYLSSTSPYSFRMRVT